MNKVDLLADTKYKFLRMFKKGKQGLTGLLLNRETGDKCVFKMSQHIDYLCEHEETVARRLNDLNCPVFSRLLDSCRMKTNPDTKAEHPFVSCKIPIMKHVLFFEYVRGYSLSKVIKSKMEVETVAILSSIKIILLATRMAYDNTKFTHYDLHTSNILMTKCDKDKHLLFKFDENNVFSVPTHGWLPVVIDYGFAYIDKIGEGPMYQSLAHTNVGFISCAPDPFADAKLFLASVSSHAVRYRRTKAVLKMRKLVKSIFGKLSMDFDCGWDVNEDSSIADESLHFLSSSNERRKGSISELFERYDHFAVDILGSLVILPLETESMSPSAEKDVLKSFRVFLKQFAKFEKIVLSSFTRIQILKIIVDEARDVMALYYDKKTQNTASNLFKKRVLSNIDHIINMADVSKINFEKMLCSLLLFARGFELYLGKRLGKLLNRKKSEYMSKLSVQNTIEIVGALELKIRADRLISDNGASNWVVLEPFKTPRMWAPTSSVVPKLNTCHPLTRGTRISRIMNT
jgi:hypothetical protein